MEREPHDFGREAPDVTTGGDPVPTWLESLPPCPGIGFADDDLTEADRQADLDIATGRAYPHSVVSEWLRTWGDSDYKPFDEWLKSSG